MRRTPTSAYFYGGIYSQWAHTPIIEDDIIYITAEHRMMYKKAELFGDTETMAKILETDCPSEAKQLGRQVKNFDKEIWESVAMDIVVDSNYLKITQNKAMAKAVILDADREIVEASRYDKIWGIGLSIYNDDVLDKSKWLGTNWLGMAIMTARDKYLSELRPLYGVMIGRCQPYHKGHASIPKVIREDGLTPVIMIGSAQEKGTEKNPLSVDTRKMLIEAAEPDVIVGKINDFNNNDKWVEEFAKIVSTLSINLRDIVVYTHNKPEDRCDFTYKGIDYKDEHYSKMLSVHGFTVKELPLSDIKVSGTALRANLENNKQFVHPQVYKELTELGWK